MKSGYKQTEVGVIPEDWEVKPFKHVTDLITCGIAATPEYVAENQGYPFLSSTNVKEGRILWSGYKHISAGLHRQLYRNNPPKRGDLLYSRVGTIGEAAVVDVDFEFSVYVSLTLIKTGKLLDPFFLMQLLNSAPYKRRAKEQVYLGGGVGNLNVDVVRKYPIPVPPLPEQRAIAGALSEVDALLGAQEALLAKKRDLKAAAMQQLLTGQKRLPGFHGEWVTKKLGEIAAVGRGRVISHVEISKSSSPTYPVFSSQTSNSGTMGYLDTYDFEGDYVTWTTDGANAGTVFARSGRFNCTNVCGTIKLYDSDHRFIAAALGRVSQPHVSRHLGNPKLMNDVMKKIDITIPITRREQTAIAAVLSDMDAELSALEERREKTRALKQGMMQELLTGRIRLV
jgi:type I restriction enzyme, S subunit